MRSLRAYLEGDFKECLRAIEIEGGLARRDPRLSIILAATWRASMSLSGQSEFLPPASTAAFFLVRFVA